MSSISPFYWSENPLQIPTEHQVQKMLRILRMSATWIHAPCLYSCCGWFTIWKLLRLFSRPHICFWNVSASCSGPSADLAGAGAGEMWHRCHDLYPLRPQSSAARQLWLWPAGTGTSLLSCFVTIPGHVCVFAFLFLERLLAPGRACRCTGHTLLTFRAGRGWVREPSQYSGYFPMLSPCGDFLHVDRTLAQIWALAGRVWWLPPWRSTAFCRWEPHTWPLGLVIIVSVMLLNIPGLSVSFSC